MLLKLVKEWQDEEERELQSHRQTVPVSPTHHPDIIGPEIDSLDPHQTVVVSREHQARAATDEIPHILEEAETSL